MLAVLLVLPEVPVTATVYVPAVAEELAVKVSVLVLVVLEELNAAVTPVGSPEAAKATLLLAPLTVIVLLTLEPPATAERELAEELRLKLDDEEEEADAATVMYIGAEAIVFPYSPITHAE
jgi:8-oxo-dGTP pyrophosphatase MutT (NUDIX family)